MCVGIMHNLTRILPKLARTHKDMVRVLQEVHGSTDKDPLVQLTAGLALANMFDVDGCDDVGLPTDKTTTDGVLHALRGVLGLLGTNYEVTFALEEPLQALRAMVRGGGESGLAYLDASCAATADGGGITTLVVCAVKRSVGVGDEGADVSERSAWFATDILAALVDAGKPPSATDEELKAALSRVLELSSRGVAGMEAAVAAEYVRKKVWPE